MRSAGSLSDAGVVSPHAAPLIGHMPLTQCPLLTASKGRAVNSPGNSCFLKGFFCVGIPGLCSGRYYGGGPLPRHSITSSSRWPGSRFIPSGMPPLGDVVPCSMPGRPAAPALVGSGRPCLLVPQPPVSP